MASPLPDAPLRQILPTAAAAAESLEDVETPVNQMQDIDTDGLDLREFRDLVRAFKEKRVGLGLTQTQAGMDLQGETDKMRHSLLLLLLFPLFRESISLSFFRPEKRKIPVF